MLYSMLKYGSLRHLCQGVIHKICHGKFDNFEPLPSLSRLRHNGSDPLTPPSSRVTEILPNYGVFLTLIKIPFSPEVGNFDRFLTSNVIACFENKVWND